MQAGGITFAMQVVRTGTLAAGNPSVPGSTQTSSLRYFHHDQLDSIAAVTEGNTGASMGSVIERLAYDPWGKRRNADGLSDTADSLVGRTTERGFTEHEHLDELGIIHMNGRIYDPLVGRFLSADPFIQAPSMLQSYNRYAYVMNNPLNLTDPSGYSWWTDFRDDVVKPIVIAVIAYYTGGAISGALYSSAGGASTAFVTFSGGTALSSVGSLSTLGGIVAGAGGGFVGGVLSTGTLKGGVQGAFSGGVFGGIGATGAGGGWGTGEYVAAHAAGGCITSVASGGACGSGAASAAFGKFTTLQTQDWGFGIAQGTAAAVAGGVGSVIAGGKFENGAVTAAYGYLFNAGLGRFVVQGFIALGGAAASQWDNIKTGWNALIKGVGNVMMSEGGADNVPPVPGDYVGDQSRGGTSASGNRHNSGPLAPANGGSGDAGKDFERLTGGTGRPFPDGDKRARQPGVLIGDNGIWIRPGTKNPGDGPRIEIPSNGNKLPETLHY